MNGRGYILKRLAEMKLKEAEKSMNQLNVNGEDLVNENLSSSMCNGINKLPVPTAQPQPQTVNLHEQTDNSVTPTFLHPTNTVSPVCNGFHKISSTQPQSESMKTQHDTQETISVESPIEEKDPVICRVSPISKNNSYKITQLASNFLEIKKKENIGIYEYTVNFNPPIDAKPARFYLLNCHRNLFPVKTFDGTSIFVPSKLQNHKTVLMSKLKDESEVILTIQYKGEKALSDCIYFYNLLMHSVMKSIGFSQFGKSFYDPEKKLIIHSNRCQLEIWPGYVTSINQFENGIHLCCDVSHRVLRTETVLESVSKLLSGPQSNNGDYKQSILTLLLNSTILTRYNNKTYLIDDIDFSMTPLSTFKQRDTEVSFVEYYKIMYNIEIKNHSQFMIITKPKTNFGRDKLTENPGVCCLVPELCCLTGLTEEMKSNNFLMKDLKQKTLNTPDVRQRALIDLVNRINDHPVSRNILNKWGLTLNSIPIKMEGPVYKKENIILGNKQGIPVTDRMDWGNDLTKGIMFTVANLNDWAIFHIPSDNTAVRTFYKYLNGCMGMNVKPPKCVEIRGNSPELFVSKIFSTVQSYPQLQLVVIVFPSQREDFYNAIKRTCCAEIGIPSQVILSRTLNNKLRSMTQKIALQINCKLGGACWAVQIPLPNTMIVGIDVYHSKNLHRTSIVGLVGSLDQTFTQWCSAIGEQFNSRQELVISVEVAFHKLLKKYAEVNSKLPEKIIIYRDGVSDGDIKIVEELELEKIKECFKIYPGNYNPKITFIIVQKRINARIYQFIDEKNQYINPPAGTVVDNTITRRDFFDFFLVSQNAHQGTVNPTHYIVLKNGCNLSTENVQRLTYKLCHLYFNWCGAIRVPCPVQYAHKLAYLIGQNVRQKPHEKLTNTLFFL